MRQAESGNNREESSRQVRSPAEDSPGFCWAHAAEGGFARALQGGQDVLSGAADFHMAPPGVRRINKGSDGVNGGWRCPCDGCKAKKKMCLGDQEGNLRCPECRL